MQEEAIKRVREMQSGNTNKSPRNISNNQKHNNPEQVAQENQQPQKLCESKPVPPLTELFKDKEKLLVLLLIMLLSQENSNTELVLALLYIII